MYIKVFIRNIKLRLCLRTRLKFYNEELPCFSAAACLSLLNRNIHGTARVHRLICNGMLLAERFYFHFAKQERVTVILLCEMGGNLIPFSDPAE